MAQLPSGARVNQYTATAGQTTFTYDFQIEADDEIRVQQNETTLTLTSEYTVTDAGEEGGGTVVLVTGASVDDVITLTGNTMVERGTTFSQGGDFNASAINGEFDRLDDMVSELVTDASLNFKLAVYSETVSAVIPTPEATKALVWNAGGTALENSTFSPDTSAAAAAASAAAALVSEGAASDSADDASGYADDASGYADDASGYADDAAASAASLDLGAVDVDVIPETDSSVDLGSTSKRWADAWVDDLTVTTDVDVGGDVTAATFNGAALPEVVKTALYKYSVAYNLDGGTSTASTWMQRPINTEVSDDIGITLSSNALTLPAGTYVYHAVCQINDIDKAQIRIRQTSGTATTLGSGVMVNQGGGDVQQIVDHGVFTLADEQTIEVQTYGSSTTSDSGLGLASDIVGLGNNIYLTFLLEKVS